jgi:hypothetical protein
MKEIKEFPGYFISKDGKVYSAWKRKNIKNKKGLIIDVKHYIDSNTVKELKSSLTSNGYLRVTLSKNKKQYTKNIHRLVAETFIENPHNYNTVNHINEVKIDNRVDNLEWCTPQKNCEHSNCKYVYTIENTETKTLIKVQNLHYWCKERRLHSSHLAETLTKSTLHKGYRIIKKESISTLPLFLSVEIAPSTDNLFICDKDSSSKT